MPIDPKRVGQERRGDRWAMAKSPEQGSKGWSARLVGRERPTHGICCTLPALHNQEKKSKVSGNGLAAGSARRSARSGDRLRGRLEMSSWAAPSESLSSDRRGAAVAPRWVVDGRLFSLFGFELLLMGSVVWSWMICRFAFAHVSAEAGDRVWAWLAMAAVGWGSLYWGWSARALRRRDVRGFRSLVAIAVASGAVAVGLLLVHIAQLFLEGPVYVDVRPLLAASRSEVAAGTGAGVAAGNANDGRKWFSATCITCHGPTGEGVPNAAPSLRDSQFLKTASREAIAALIRNGRLATDPANKTGKVMPAKGGNPFLDEAKIADLVAFLQDLVHQGGSGAAGRSPGDVPRGQGVAPPVTLGRWVVPDPDYPLEPSTWVAANGPAPRSWSQQRSVRDAQRYEMGLKWLSGIAASVLSLHLLWVSGCGAAVVLYRELGLSSGGQLRLLQHAYVFWAVGAVWMVLWFAMFFWVR